MSNGDHFITIYGLFNNKRRMDREKTLKYAPGIVNMPLLRVESSVLHGSLDRVFDTFEWFP